MLSAMQNYSDWTHQNIQDRCGETMTTISYEDAGFSGIITENT